MLFIPISHLSSIRFRAALPVLCLLIFQLSLSSCSSEKKNSNTPSVAPNLLFHENRFGDHNQYHISKPESKIVLSVYRSGALARLGHNHIISHNNVHGKIYLHKKITKSGALLRVPVTSFIVDDPELRKMAGTDFTSTPSSKDISGTRSNMLSMKILDADVYPDITLASSNIRKTGADTFEITLHISLRNFISELIFPVKISINGNKIIVTGTAQFQQSDLGIEPFSILMGAIKVQDTLDAHFQLVAYAH